VKGPLQRCTLQPSDGAHLEAVLVREGWFFSSLLV